jgi:metal-sulfur cluster biosynthetic enzyme
MYNAGMTAKTKTIEKEVMKKLENVIDPELYISIVDLGLVYGVTHSDGKVMVKMTLTTIGCPLITIIEKDIQEKLADIDGVKEVAVDLVFDPPWDIERMSEKGKAMMGI